jgi:pimeloyl-ACP methyl ester carboxylesterase
MPHLTVRHGGSGSVELYYEDQGSGRPVVLVHGWPLCSSSWEKQVPALLAAGYRVVYYDRRGFGGSSRPASGYDYDTLAADLDALLTTLDLRDAALVGFAMGAGECARYLARYGSARIGAVAFVAAILPFLLATADNPGGVPAAALDGMAAALAHDRHAFTAAFLRDYYNAGLGGGRASEELVHASWVLAAGASALALAGCVRAWRTDFRADVARIDVPALVLHGDDDAILPIAATGLRLHESVPGSRWVVVEGGAHGLLWTHADEVNRELLSFLERAGRS